MKCANKTSLKACLTHKKTLRKTTQASSIALMFLSAPATQAQIIINDGEIITDQITIVDSAGATINNSGVIKVDSGEGSTAIRIIDSSVDIINSETGTISGGFRGLDFEGDNGFVTITGNEGTIFGDNDSGISIVGDNDSVTIADNTGTISSNLIGLDFEGDNGSVILAGNAGIISSRFIGLNFDGDNGSVSIVGNTGTISGRSRALSFGGDNGLVTINDNAGIISGDLFFSGDKGSVNIADNLGTISGRLFFNGDNTSVVITDNIGTISDGLSFSGDGSSVIIADNAGIISGNITLNGNNGFVNITGNTGTISDDILGLAFIGNNRLTNNSDTLSGLGNDSAIDKSLINIIDNSGSISGGRYGIGSVDVVISIIDNVGMIFGLMAGIAVAGETGSIAVTDNSGIISGGLNGIIVTDTLSSISNSEGGVIQGGVGTGILLETSADIKQSTLEESWFINAGTISGGTFSFDASNAVRAFTFEQQGGGVLDGDFLGRIIADDQFDVTNGQFTLTHDVLQGVNVNVVSASGITFGGEGSRTIDGDLISDGDLTFTLGNAAAIVNGDVTLNALSTVTVGSNSQASSLGQQFTLIDLVDGVLDNNATLVNSIDETSFLLDFVFVESDNDLVVESVAAISSLDELGSENVNVDSFGDSLISAFNAEQLSTNVASVFANQTQEQFTASVVSLLPDLSNSASRQVLDAVNSVGGLVSQRLGSLTSNVNSKRNNAVARSSNAVYTSTSYEQSNIVNVSHHVNVNIDLANRSGAWVQGSYYQSDQEVDDSVAGFDNSYDANSISFAIGYDTALNDNTLLGVSAAYTSTDIDLQNASSGQTELDVYQFTAYGLRQYGALQVNGQISYVTADAESERTTFLGTASSDFDLDGFSLQAQANYTWRLGKTGYITPLVGLQYSEITRDAYTESGGLNVTLSRVDNELLEGRLGLRIGEQIVTSNSLTDLYLNAAIVNDFGSGPDDLSVSFSSQSDILSVFDADDQRLELGAGVDWFYDYAYSITASVNGQFSNDDYSSVGARVQFKYNF